MCVGAVGLGMGRDGVVWRLMLRGGGLDLQLHCRHGNAGRIDELIAVNCIDSPRPGRNPLLDNHI